ncbi:hypothetical protein NFI96_034344 [Prochilodus magdalenae]|nr:hypothetical protein NFI96_034344 [Prochilodus magdalenae]
MGNLILLLLALCAISYCEANRVPIISNSVEQVKEDTLEGGPSCLSFPVKIDFFFSSAGAHAFQISASDPDGDTLTYDIADPAGHFSANRNTGEVSIIKMLDREATTHFTVHVSVNDGQYSISKDITIIVVDANDNAPTFRNLPYNFNVPEDKAVESTVMTVTATDPDEGTGGIVSYKIKQVIPSEGTNMFAISSTGGQVTLKEPLSFTDKSAFYQIVIEASDGGGPLNGAPIIQSSNTTAFLTVTDVADQDPQFLNLPNEITVDENSAVGTSVFKVQARDPDTGINDAILYSIEDTNAPNLFQISEADGLVSVSTVFDREALLNINAVVELTIKATEANVNINGVHASATATLKVTIGDVNDNGPLIYKCEGDTCTEHSSFTGDIKEHSAVGLSVSGFNMRVKDLDQGENSRFLLELNGPDKDAFSVSPTSSISESNVLLLVKDPSLIDYEQKKTMTVEVVATDASETSFVSTATVTIQINDTNDNVPVFEKQTYKLSVFEHCVDGTSVGTVTATDKDELDEGKLNYTLLPESILAYFAVDQTTGVITVKNGKLLDRELTSSYSPTLQARDSGGNVGTTILEITVEDINDQTPQFSREYEVFIRENNPLSITVEARDGDQPDTHNSRIQYAIVDSDYSGNFTIGRETGIITSASNLDREAIDSSLNGVIELNVTATDMGVPALSTWVKVVINVDDINDNKPVYLDPNYTFDVKESITVGHIFARDADQTEYNNRISFRITNGLGSFLCTSEPNDNGEGYMGIIMVDPDVELDYESDRKSYTLNVEATDLGKLMDTVTVQVEVKDVNDLPPVFPSNLIMTIKENSPPVEHVGVIRGSDADTNHSLIYELVSTKCHCNNTWGPCEEEWITLYPNGIVISSADYTIDYEKCDAVDMTARVVDIYTEKGRNSTEGTVMINILDMNDNAPEFIPLQEYFVVLSESVEQSSSVASVYATDKDSAENAKITFEVVGVEFSSSNTGENPEQMDIIFSAETSEQPDSLGNYNGVIRSRQSLDPDKKGRYFVQVKAQNLNLSSVETLELITVDKSFRVGLRFEKPVSEVNQNLPNIRAVLTTATKAMVHVVRVSSESTRQEQRNPVTLLEAYFVFPNGTALDSDSVVRILNSKEVYEQYGAILHNYGLTTILSGPTDLPEDNTTLFILIGVVGALVIVLTVMTTSLVCVRRSYKRKLKAAKAMNTAAMEAAENQKAGPVVPGTNKYTRDGANPVLNLNIDSATDLGFDEDGSSADRESLNSLDYNMDMNMSEKGSMPMTMIAEEEEDMYESVVEPLGAALAQRGRRTDHESFGLTIANPALNTTDL